MVFMYNIIIIISTCSESIYQLCAVCWLQSPMELTSHQLLPPVEEGQPPPVTPPPKPSQPPTIMVSAAAGDEDKHGTFIVTVALPCHALGAHTFFPHWNVLRSSALLILSSCRMLINYTKGYSTGDFIWSS